MRESVAEKQKSTNTCMIGIHRDPREGGRGRERGWSKVGSLKSFGNPLFIKAGSTKILSIAEKALSFIDKFVFIFLS